MVLKKKKKVLHYKHCKDCKCKLKYKYETVVCFHCHQKRMK